MPEVSSQHTTLELLDRLRNDGVPGHEISVAIATLIYLRWADFQEAEQEAIASFDETDYKPVLPDAMHWRSWHHLPMHELAEFLRYRLPAALSQLNNARHNPLATHLHRIAWSMDTVSRLSVQSIVALVHWLSDQPFETPKDRRHLLGAFDDLLDKTADNFTGWFKTPTHIAKLLVELATPSSGDCIYDPCFGSANLLTAAYDFVLNREKEGFISRGVPALVVAGVEINPSNYVIGLTRLVLSGIDDPKLELGNSLERPASSTAQQDGFDVVVANPPWGGRIDPAGLDHFPVRTSDSTSLFVQHALSQLRPEGRAVLVVPQGLLFRSGPELKLRKLLVEQHSVEAVVSLPAGVFRPYTSIRSSILVLRRGGPTNHIRMVDAEPYFENGKGRQAATIRNVLTQQLAENVRASKPSEHCWDIGVESLAEIEWDFTPLRRDQSALFATLESLRGKVDVVKLRECCSILNGRLIRSDGLVEEPTPEQSIGYVRIKDLQRGWATKVTSWLTMKAAASVESNWKLREGDVLLSKSGTIGKAGLVRNEAVGAIAASGLFVLRTDQDRLDPHFLLAYLDSTECRAWLDDRARGETIRHLSKRTLDELPVPLPPPQMQQWVAGQYHEHGVDALIYLAQLLTKGKSDPVIEWVEAALKNLPSGSDAISEPLSLEPLDRLAADVTLLRNSVAHATIGDSQLAMWLLAFAQATSVLHGVRNIPRGPSLLSLLQEAARRLHTANEAIKGHLPYESRARTLNGILLKWIEKGIAALLSDIKLVLATKTNTLHIGDMVEFDLEVYNLGALPLREVRIATEPDWGHGEFGYLAEEDSATMQLRSVGPKLPGTFTITARWSGLTLNRQHTQGTQEIAFNVIDEDKLGTTEAIDLGGSPYVCGDPIYPERDDVFFGREELLDQICRQVIQSGNVVLLEGNRRTGKTSILLHLEGPEAVPGWMGVYCSLQGAEGSRHAVGIPTVEVYRGIAYDIVRGLQTLGGETPLPDGSVLPVGGKLRIARACREGIGEESPFGDFRDYAEVVLDVLEKRNLGLLLMLDEFDKLHEGIRNSVTSPQVPENIRFLVQTHPRLSAILTGSRRLKHLREEYWSALYGLGTRFGVTSLPSEAARRLVTEPVKGRLTYSGEAVERAIALTAGHPFLLQCLCNHIFDIAAQLKTRSVTLDLVTRASYRLVEDNEHFAELWGYTRSDRRRFILALGHKEAEDTDPFADPFFSLGIIQEGLSSYGIEVDDETLIADFELLRELELIELVGAGEYTLAMPLMGVWIDKQQDFAALQTKARSETEDQHV